MRRLIACAALAFTLAAALPPALSARQTTAKARPDLGEFTKEVMAIRFDGGQHTLAVWTPYEFFLAANLSDPKSSLTEIESVLGFLRSYVIIMASSSFERPDGSDEYASEADMRKRAVLKLADGTEVAPMAAIPPKVAAVTSAMKSFMAAQGGADRESMGVLVFPAATASGKTVVDTTRKDSLTLLLKADARFREGSFVWRTPFDAMSSVAPCPKCRAAMSVKWSHCPYDGTKLP